MRGGPMPRPTGHVHKIGIRYGRLRARVRFSWSDVYDVPWASKWSSGESATWIDQYGALWGAPEPGVIVYPLPTTRNIP